MALREDIKQEQAARFQGLADTAQQVLPVQWSQRAVVAPDQRNHIKPLVKIHLKVILLDVFAVRIVFPCPGDGTLGKIKAGDLQALIA